MLDLIWLVLLLGGILAGALTGKIELVTGTLFSGANEGVKVCLDLIGLMTLWLGMLEIAKQAGLITLIARWMRPLTRVLFPGVPPEHPALGAIIMNISANILGLGNAATPFGLKAMEELQKINPDPGKASDAMCTFLALNTSCLTLIPATIIGVRVAAGSSNPTEVVAPTIIATGFSMVIVVLIDIFWRTLLRPWYRRFKKC
ncbi:MAG TPA: spore maturation protein [Syntrophomonadaceae bacterium]|nr:spore maturation protein [Syntrophomonadaceae bacterium]